MPEVLGQTVESAVGGREYGKSGTSFHGLRLPVEMPINLFGKLRALDSGSLQIQSVVRDYSMGNPDSRTSRIYQ